MSRALIWLQSVLLAVVVSWPLVARFTSQAVGSPEGDGAKHLWTLWWMRREFFDGTAGLRTVWVNFPEGMDLFPIEPLNGVLALFLPLSPVTLSNVLALLHLVLLGVCAAWLGGLVSGSRLGAHAAGALAQASSFTAFTLHVGVGELRQYWWLPLGLGCLLRAHETLAWRWFLALAGTLAGAALSCFYHGLFLGSAVAVWALCTLRPKWRLLAGYALAAGLAVGVVVPVVKGFADSFGHGAPTPIFDERGSVVEEYRHSAMNLDQLYTPRNDSRAAAQRQELAYTGGRYLGFVALGLGLLGLVAAPRRALPWLAVLVASAILSLGTVLWYQDHLVVRGGHRMVMPLAYLNDALRKVGEPINFPARFIAPGMIALAALGSLASRWRWAMVLVPVAVVDLLRHDLVPWPRDTFPLPDTSALAQAGGTGAVADLSLAIQADPESRRMDVAAQIAMGRPFQGVPIERLSEWSNSGAVFVAVLPLVQVLSTLVGNATVDLGADYRADLWLLRDRGFDRLLITHRQDTPDQRVAQLLTHLCGEPVRSPHGTVWSIPEVAATAEEGEAWRATQAARVAAKGPASFGPQFSAPAPRSELGG